MAYSLDGQLHTIEFDIGRNDGFRYLLEALVTSLTDYAVHRA